ncbi:MAG: sulfatase-like hydrolase/transferase, partial [Gammaproteobacteria bacterium]|nr:sulfatase-like hydrolase/transferase [Gammaproteobacteria bacterium]
ILKEITGYDNELFLKELEKKEFIVSRNARSNYSFTKASLSATMDLSYHEPDKIKIFSYASMRESLSGKNKVREVFRRNGYHIVNIPAHWYETRCFGNEDTCVKKGSVEVYQSFLSPTPLRIFISPSTYVDLDLVKDASDVAPGKPKFVFAHIAQLHDAVYDGYGNMHRVQSNRDSISYVSTVKIMNAKILGFIEYIRAKDPKSIIIIQADHGPPAYIVSQNYGKELHLKNKQDFRFKFGIFTGIYLPKYDINKYAKIRKYFSDFFTLINTFRYVFAYLSDQEPELLPEESHFLYPDKSGLSYIEDNIDQLTN